MPKDKAVPECAGSRKKEIKIIIVELLISTSLPGLRRMASHAQHSVGWTF